MKTKTRTTEEKREIAKTESNLGFKKGMARKLQANINKGQGK